MPSTPARGAPNPNRPRLSEELERQLEPADRRSAEGYTRIDEAIDAVDQALESGAITVSIEVTDTVMHHLTKAKEAIDTTEEPTDPLRKVP